MSVKQNTFQLIVMVVAIVTLFHGLQGCASNRNLSPWEDPVTAETITGDANSISDEKASFESPSENRDVVAISTPFGDVYQKKSENTKGLSTEDLKEASKTSSPAVTSASIEAVDTQKWKIDGSKGVEVQNATKSTGVSREASSEDVSLNFDDADLYEVIRTMAELLQINYIVDPSVRGKVTINTAGGLKTNDLWPVFFQILEVNGLTAVREEKVYKIAPLKDASRLPILSIYGRDATELAPTERVIMQIIPLQHANSAEMVKVLTPFISSEGTIISDANSNTLLVVDKGVNILKVLRLVEVFDNDFFDENLHRFYFLSHAESAEVSDLLNNILNVYSQNEKGAFEIIPISRLNALLVISKHEGVFDKIETLLKTVDSVIDTAQKKIYVYAVKNGKALELGELLDKIFSNESDKETTSDKVAAKEATDAQPPQPNTPFMDQSTNASEAGGRVSSSVAAVAAGTGTLGGLVKITPDEVRNALIIEATSSDYRILESILSKLDVMPRQVLIEMTFAEISLDDSLKMGVEWEYLAGKGTPSTAVISAAIGSDQGFRYAIGEADRWNAALQALASESKINILATPSILASDNKEAQIDIADEIPIVTSTYTNTESRIVTTNVQYRNTGLLLKVTPHINENGLVSMDLNQEISEVAGNKEVAGVSYPSFSKRTVNTSLVVKHRQTIVIGGLMKETKSIAKSGVPWLNKLPVFGFIFGMNSNSIDKKELIIMITPHVLVNLDDIDEITSEVQEKLARVRLDMTR